MKMIDSLMLMHTIEKICAIRGRIGLGPLAGTVSLEVTPGGNFC